MELTAVRETQQQGLVEKQMLEGERSQLTEALTKVGALTGSQPPL